MIQNFQNHSPVWKLLVVDDDEDIHLLTESIFGNRTFKSKKIEILSAYSKSESEKILKQHKDIALVLLDIVLDREDDGLHLVRYIREQLKNIKTRIILRTAKADLLSEEKMMIRYDIDDFKSKEELTPKKLITSVFSCLKSFELLEQLDREKENAERQAKRLYKQLQLFYKFVPESLIMGLDYKDFSIQDGISKVVKYNILTCDMRNFTTLSENLPSYECFRFLNSYFQAVEPDISCFGGFVYQYVGDGILALFKLNKGIYANNVVHSALSLQDRMVILNKDLEKAGFEPVRIGVGLNTGYVAIGVAGTEKRLGASAFGHSINVSSRCESLTKAYGVNIIMTEDTYKNLEDPEMFLIRTLGKTEIRGLKKKIQLYEVFNTDQVECRDEKLETKEKFEEIFESLDQYKVKDAIQMLKEVAIKTKKDPLPHRLLSLLLKEPMALPGK